ncbi:MAG TPA: ferredoxin [Mycobacteriales bacterium]|nr:ferredoxin [Mycobacteriales bacterium]HWA66968.1 ferredoxin [Mycobacteriales bacterium]
MTRIVHDATLCEAHGVCTTIDPARFELDDDDYLTIHSYEVSEADRPAMEQAVIRCPRQALSLAE